jgi:hypothetical protein
MSLASCPKCWDDTCSCGYQYKDWSWKRIFGLFKNIIKYKLKNDKRRNTSK